MDSVVAEIRELVRGGRFSEAARRFDSLPGRRTDADTTLLKASILEMLGEHSEAESLVLHVLRSRALPDRERAAGEFTLARVCAATGCLDAELGHLNKSLALAERCSDTERASWAQLRLVALADRFPTRDGFPDMSRLRHSISCSGDPNLSAALHLVAADLDGMRGLLAKSRRHVTLAQSILSRYPNLWLSGWSEVTLLALSLIQCDIPGAVEHGTKGIELGRASGAAAIVRHSLANLGRVYYTTGEFDLALTYLSQALAMTRGDSDIGAAIVDSMARLHLAQGDVARAAELTCAPANLEPAHAGGYTERHSLLTRAEVLVRLGEIDLARSCIDQALRIARGCGDRLLEDEASLRADELSHAAGTSSDGRPIGPPLHATPDSTILYERALMCRLMAGGDHEAARRHRDRALRIARALKNKPADSQIQLAWTTYLGREEVSRPSASGASAAAIQNFAALLMHVGRPELLSSGLIAILQEVPCIQGARAVVREADGTEQCIGSCGTMAASAHIRTFCLSESNQRTVVLEVQAPQDVESQATVNSIGFIIAAVQDLERARLEREERQTLWPADELPAENDDSVVAGKMRDIMLYSRKVAQTNVTVLITGESGTGKEVVARAIHRYSPRAKKPFVPFNCTAVPRELLESHLFGFRRGAFTGADRDNPGLIRAAKDGTLFLDEIGELGLDLQPKLLRFLESGEINPLGDTSPFPVNVRIVAATNADLQKLVAEGRFREDLYYRLSVIPIPLPPLRDRREEVAPLAQHFALKWSHELGKGRMRVADDLMEHLVLYPWPGNIRQLSNEIHRMVAVADANQPLTLEHLPRALRLETERLKRLANGLELAVPLTDRMDRAVENLEREMIKVALRTNHGKVEATAQALGLSRKGLYLKRQRFGL